MSRDMLAVILCTVYLSLLVREWCKKKNRDAHSLICSDWCNSERQLKILCKTTNARWQVSVTAARNCPNRSLQRRKIAAIQSHCQTVRSQQWSVMCCCFMMDVLWDSYGNLCILLEKDYLNQNMQIFSSFHASNCYTVQALVMSVFRGMKSAVCQWWMKVMEEHFYY